MVKKKKRCCKEDCRKKLGLIGMECKYCLKMFCCNHITPEIHQCEYIEKMREEKNNELSHKLMSQKMVVDKIITI